MPLAILFALAACRKQDGPLSARDSTFVATMIDLRRLPSGSDSAARQAVLRRNRTTAASLEAVAAELASDPVHAADLWRRIEQAPAAPITPVPAPKSAPLPPPKR